jgi:hypothetical protein
MAHGPSLRGYLGRVACGDAAVPMERSFQVPDDVFALGQDRETRARVSRSFVSLDDNCFFVRCLLPIPAGRYGSWSFGLWIEVSKLDYERGRRAWDDPVIYPKLRLSGTLANDLSKDLELPGASVVVELRVPDPEAPPMILATSEPDLAKLLADGWSEVEFEDYAVARGFL